MTGTVGESRKAAVREHVMRGVAALLDDGQELTFAALAKASGVPERTIYRHFPTREALLSGLFAWVNEQIGFDGHPPEDAAAAKALVRTAFPGFARMAPAVRALLIAPGGLTARLEAIDERRRAALALVRSAAPGLGRTSERRVAAIVQLLGTAATWQTLTDYWDMDGDEAGESAALAIELVLDGARARAAQRKTRGG